ncbi:MAG: hypothetical protein LBV71_11810 [Prevotella sp.]|jgi:hypothetical protein|nr:hypothetical protein [Prevotella sp.]
MKKITFILFYLIFLGTLTLSAQSIIKTPAPPRPAGQTDVLGLRCDPIPTVRVGFIGIGQHVW